MARSPTKGGAKSNHYGIVIEFFVFCMYMIYRQDLKKPTKKLVQPTVVLPEASRRKETAEETSRSADNPVVTAAAIAAAAASAATGPFLQVNIKNTTKPPNMKSTELYTIVESNIKLLWSLIGLLI